jgi:hypothetical protein
MTTIFSLSLIKAMSMDRWKVAPAFINPKRILAYMNVLKE